MDNLLDVVVLKLATMIAAQKRFIDARGYPDKDFEAMIIKYEAELDRARKNLK